jgi:hypothetical protein
MPTAMRQSFIMTPYKVHDSFFFANQKLLKNAKLGKTMKILAFRILLHCYQKELSNANNK